MSITSVEFVFMLPLVVFVFYMIPERIRQHFLLVINLLFYISFGTWAVIVVIIEAVWSFLFGLLLDRSKGVSGEKSHSKYPILILLGVVGLVAFLLAFKINWASIMGDRNSELFTSITAPIGMSFYTLQALSYIVDVYQGHLEAEHNFINLITYLSFFPTVTSGPIVRYKEFRETPIPPSADYIRITNGIIYIIYGYFMKLVIAERAAIPVNHIYSDFDVSVHSGIVLAIVAMTYSVQIYADFAGYSAIVIGIAQILGYDLLENFTAPYLAGSIREFWTRWHNSFSLWLRDYIYIPLGGNRKGKKRKYINLIITFMVSGLWHGLYGHFFAWGGMHAIYQIISDVTSNFRHKLLLHIGIIPNSAFHKLLTRLFTFMWVTLAWIFFKTGIKEAIGYIVRMITHPGIAEVRDGELWDLGLSPFWWLLLLISVLFVLFWDIILYLKGLRFDQAIASQGSFAKFFIIIVMSLTTLIFGIYGDQHDVSYFVYSQF